MSRLNMIIENQIPDTASSLKDTEAYLTSVCEEYGLDYNNLDKDPDYEVATEGIISSIVKFIKMVFTKAIQIIVSLWKKLVGIVKAIIKWIVTKVKNLFSKKDKEDNSAQEIMNKSHYNASFCMESLEPNEVPEINGVRQYNSLDSLKAAFKKSMDKISAEINKESKRNIEDMKKFEKSCVKNNAVTESAVIERIIYQDFHIGGTDLDTSNFSAKGKELNEIIKELVKMGGVEAVYQQGSMFDQANIEDLRTLNAEKLRELKNAGDAIFEEYEAYKSRTIERIIEIYKKRSDDYAELMPTREHRKPRAGNQVMSHIVMVADILEAAGFSKENINMALADNVFPKFNNDEEGKEKLKTWIQLKLNFNKGIIDALQKMLDTNKEIFGLSVLEASVYQQDLFDGDITSFRELFKQNMHKFLNKDDCIIDLSPIGFGTFIMSQSVFTGHIDATYIMTDTTLTDRLIIYGSRYDAILLTHGGNRYSTLGEMIQHAKSMGALQEEYLKKNYKEQIEIYKNELHISYDELANMSISEEERIIQDYLKTHDSLDIFQNASFKERTSNTKQKKKFGLAHSFIKSQLFNQTKSQRWFCDPVKIPIEPPALSSQQIEKNKRLSFGELFKQSLAELIDFSDDFIAKGKYKDKMNDLEFILCALYDLGYKNILVLACNPGRIALPKYIRDSNSFLVTMSTRSTLM